MAPLTMRQCLNDKAVRSFSGRRVVRRNVCSRTATLESPNATADQANMKDMYAQFDQLLEKSPMRHSVGDVVKGSIIAADRKGALVDVGGKGAAYLPLQEITVCQITDASELLRPGMVREFTVIEDRREEIKLSMSSQEKAVQWQRMRQLQQEDVTVDGTVVSANRGGVMVDVMNLRGFVPNSHLGQVRNKDDMMGEVLPLKFMEVDEEAGRIMFSCRRAQSEDRLANYKVGDVVEGVVANVTFYGAFLEIAPNVIGLLHISQISHDRVTNVEKLLNVGDKLKVMIMSQDKERGRLALSTKKLEPTPGDMLKDPAAVFARAEEMAELFKSRVQAAEKAARDEEARLATSAAEATEQ